MKTLNILALLFGLALFHSCGLSKKVVYVGDMTTDSIYNVVKAPPLRLQKADRVSITVHSKDPELAAPFNAMTGAYTVSENGTISTREREASVVDNYVLDQQGNIDFPVLGKLALEGLSTEEVRDLIRGMLIDKGLINDPVVKVNLLNLKINVMGEVSSIGIIEVPESKINLLEVISKAGGLTRNAAPDRVTVIREENGVRKKVYNDIRSQELFNSPTFHLQQNDIVYVEPKSAETSVAEDRAWRYWSLGIGMFTLTLTLLNLFK
ncbi:polysaccharide biosynthesis/export family protein [Sphingobacterium suaedae]|uniref:Polysaccharide biosynthesis/export family protein n=1 Tax=Sphingobacterium suaedae TaxID=1686402 RepID=A0ABW5KP30_9SPHI